MTNEAKAIGICPTVDFAFKLVFGSPGHSRVTIHFLNAILGLPIRIQQVTIRNPILGQEAEDDKLAILDILAIDEQGRLINIEIQTTVPAGMHQRLTFYVSSMYSGQLTEGDSYTSLRPAISICVLTKPMFSDDPRLHLDFRLRDASGLVLTDDMQVHLLQLSKLTVNAQNVAIAKPVEQWAFFLLNAEKLTPEEIRQLLPDDEFSEAAGVLEMISKNSEQRQLYDARLKFQRDQAARLEDEATRLAAEAARLEKARSEARSEGLSEGRKEGLNEGLNEGRKVGRKEGRKEGRNEGLREGIEKGELFGRIRTLQNLLGITETAREELSECSESELSQLAEELKLQLRKRGP